MAGKGNFFVNQNENEAKGEKGSAKWNNEWNENSRKTWPPRKIKLSPSFSIHTLPPPLSLYIIYYHPNKEDQKLYESDGRNRPSWNYSLSFNPVPRIRRRKKKEMASKQRGRTDRRLIIRGNWVEIDFHLNHSDYIWPTNEWTNRGRRGGWEQTRENKTRDYVTFANLQTSRNKI